MVEIYWMALARDVPTSMYGLEPITQAAIADMNRLSDFRGPKQGGRVTAHTLFRASEEGATVGPHISQFFVMPAPFGALSVTDSNGNPAQLYNVYVPNKDYMHDHESWLNVQNGAAPAGGGFGANFGANEVLGPRLLRSGRDLSAFVHVDELYQAYFMATLNLL